MFTWAFFFAVGFAFLDWACTWKGWKKRLYIAKPATLVFLIIWTIQLSAWKVPVVWFGIALLCSLAGDIALMLNPRYFIVGGAAFLFAHLAYLVGFNQSPAPLSLGVILVAVLVGISAARVFRLIRPGIMTVPRGKRFLTALSMYGLTLTFMLLSAVITLFREEWGRLPALLTAGGGILFYLSDTLLMYDRFVCKVKNAQSYVHLTYHLAQLSIITGALIQYLDLI